MFSSTMLVCVGLIFMIAQVVVKSDSIKGCIATTSNSAYTNNESHCLQLTAGSVRSSVSSGASLTLAEFNADGTPNSTRQFANAWSTAVVLSFVQSLPSSRTDLLVSLNTATIASNKLSIVNSSASVLVSDLGAMNASVTSFSGYLIDLASIVAVTDSNGYNLVYQPAYHTKDILLQNKNSGFFIVTWPSSLAAGISPSYFGAMYPIDASSQAMVIEFLLSLSRTYNMRMTIIGNLTVSGTILVSSIIDDGASDTPVPIVTLPNTITSSPPIQQSVLSWYVYLIIALGCVGLIGIFVCVAKKAALRREDKKKTAKLRKKEHDRFEKMTHDLRKGIELDKDDQI